MDDESSYEEDFSESVLFDAEEDEKPQTLVRKKEDNSSFEFISTDEVFLNVLTSVDQVQSFLSVSNFCPFISPFS